VEGGRLLVLLGLVVFVVRSPAGRPVALEATGGGLVHHPVVELQEGQVGLGDDGVLVVAVVADDRSAIGAARKIVQHGGQRPTRSLGIERTRSANAEAGPGGGQLGVVELIAPGRAEAVEAVEVERRRPLLLDLGQVVQKGEVLGSVVGDVVVDELAEVGKASRDARVV